MLLSNFEIRKIGPMFRHIAPPFARADVSIGVRDDGQEIIHAINLDVAVTYQNADTIDAVKRKILSESLRVLKAAVAHLDGKDVQSLYHSTAEDEEKLERLRMKSYDASNSPAESA